MFPLRFLFAHESVIDSVRLALLEHDTFLKPLRHQLEGLLAIMFRRSAYKLPAPSWKPLTDPEPLLIGSRSWY
jgi:hypothetical protein